MKKKRLCSVLTFLLLAVSVLAVAFSVSASAEEVDYAEKPKIIAKNGRGASEGKIGKIINGNVSKSACIRKKIVVK